MESSPADHPLNATLVPCKVQVKDGLLREQASQQAPMATKLEFMVKFGKPGEQILLASHALDADLIILGLNGPAHIDTASYMPWAVAYKVVCGARCPVLTIRN